MPVSFSLTLFCNYYLSAQSPGQDRTNAHRHSLTANENMRHRIWTPDRRCPLCTDQSIHMNDRWRTSSSSAHDLLGGSKGSRVKFACTHSVNIPVQICGAVLAGKQKMTSIACFDVHAYKAVRSLCPPHTKRRAFVNRMSSSSLTSHHSADVKGNTSGQN